MFELFLDAFVDLLVRLNRSAQRPLGRLVPELARLRADPAREMRERAITIGPRSPRGTILLTTVGFTVILYCSGLGLFLQWSVRQAPVEQPALMGRMARLLALSSFGLGLPFLVYVAARQFFRGGWLLLDADGVRFLYRRDEVFCPWVLFDREGLVDRAGDRWVMCPVAGKGLPGVTVRRNGAAVSQGPPVNTAQVQLSSGSQLRLRNLYEADVRECAELLLSLGRVLGRAKHSHEVTPVAPTNIRGAR